MRRQIVVTPAMLQRVKEGEILSEMSEHDRVGMGITFIQEEQRFVFRGSWGQDWSEVVPDAKTCRFCFGSSEGNTEVRYVWSAAPDVEVVATDEWACQACIFRRFATDILPPRYRWVHYSTLRPTDMIDLSVEHQARCINDIAEGCLDGHSIVFGGPSRNGKSVLTCALATRMVTLYGERGWYSEAYTDDDGTYYADGPGLHGYRIPIYHLNANLWLKRMQDYETRDFNQDSDYNGRVQISAPQPNAETILQTTRNFPLWKRSDVLPLDLKRFPPVLLVEEIDKFNPTPYRLNTLFTLLDTVMSHGGMIISTTNLSYEDLKAHFGEDNSWFYRRLMESSHDSTLRFVDMYPMIKQTTLKPRRSPHQKAKKVA